MEVVDETEPGTMRNVLLRPIAKTGKARLSWKWDKAVEAEMERVDDESVVDSVIN